MTGFGNSQFWEHADQLVAASEVIIDRPAGSLHPRYPDVIYPLDYGYLAGTAGGMAKASTSGAEASKQRS